MKLSSLPSLRIGLLVLSLFGCSAGASDACPESDSGCGGPHEARVDGEDRESVDGFLRDVEFPDAGQPVSYRGGYGATFHVSRGNTGECVVRATLPGFAPASLSLDVPRTPGPHSLADVGATASFSRTFALQGTLVVREAPQASDGLVADGAWSFHLTTSAESPVQADLDVVALSSYRRCTEYY